MAATLSKGRSAGNAGVHAEAAPFRHAPRHFSA